MLPVVTLLMTSNVCMLFPQIFANERVKRYVGRETALCHCYLGLQLPSSDRYIG